MRRPALLLAGLLVLPPAALADSQSSNSSTSCSNGRCTRVESLVIQDRWGQRGWVREDRWRERGGRPVRDREWRGWHPYPPYARPRRGRDDDDDGDDD